MTKNKTLIVKGTAINLFQTLDTDFISLTDIARYKDSDNTDDIIKNWMRNRNTIELLGFWEMLYNKDFNPSNSTGLEYRLD